MTRTLSAQEIECPKCHATFALADSVEKRVREQLSKEFASQESAMREEFQEKVDELAEKNNEATAKLNEEKLALEKTIAKRVEAVKISLETIARSEASAELDAVQRDLAVSNQKLRDAQAKELELRRGQKALEDAKAEFELVAARKLDEEREKIRADVEGRIGQAHELKSLEWQKKSADMEKLIDELRKKSEQGSQQLQGEVLELEVESVLREVFPHDSVEPVAKGVRGGDALQVVKTRGGSVAGSILWEVKRTKAFSDAWVSKLKDNQRSAKAEVAVIITTALPEGVKHIGQVDGVWVTDFQSFTGIALALRASLLELASAKVAQAGAKEKSAEVYEYLNGAEFRGRVQGIVESFVSMKEDLESEKRAFEKVWAKRDKQLTRALTSTAGFYGDLQGLIGSSLQEIPQLALEVK